MSEEYANLGTVRRRPRPGSERPESEAESAGQPNGAYQQSDGGAKRPNGSARPSRDEEPQGRRRSESKQRKRERREDRAREEKPGQNLPWREIQAEAPLFRCPFDPWRLFGAVKRKTGTILLVSTILGMIGFLVGAVIVPYKMSLPLIRKTSNAVRSDSALPNQFTPREYSDGTLYAFMKSGDVISKVIEKTRTNALLAPLHVTSDELAKSISVVPLANPDFVILKLSTFGSMRPMAELLNIYAQEAVDQLREVQRRESASINIYLQNQLAEADNRIENIKIELRGLSDSGFVSYDREAEDMLAELRKMRESLAEKQLSFGALDEQVATLDDAVPNTRLLTAKQQLQDLLLSRTERHPDVIMKRTEIAMLEKQQESGKSVRGGGGNGSDAISLRRMELITSKPMLEKEIQDLTSRIAALTNRLSQRSGKDMSYAIKKAELESREKSRDELQKAAREAQLYAEASLGYFGILDPATEKSIDKRGRWIKVGLLGLLFGFVGAFLTSGIALVREALDTTVKTPEDIMRVCKLPVLASLGDLKKMSAKQQADWAFRTLTLLKGKLSRNADQALVCGIISANHGEGRSTWVSLLVNAASQRGLRVLTVDTRPGTEAPASGTPPPAPPAQPKAEPVNAEKAASVSMDKNAGHGIKLPDHTEQPDVAEATAENTSGPATGPLSSPEKVAEQLSGPSAQPLVHIPLPGWVWSLERRKQWHSALENWRNVDNLVIFVELPPACESESVLLAENLPQVIWLVGSGMPDAAETATHLETLRHAHCNVVGAVLNHAPPPFLNSKIGRWLNPVTSLAFLFGSLCLNSIAAENAPSELQSAAAESQATVADTNAAPEQPLNFGANSKRQRAKWQERLTFGPGDSIDIHFFGNPGLSRTNVFIGPDGRINYLQANGLNAAGLTVEELRQKLDEELANYYPAARTIVHPVSFSSKKYFMLGKVNSKGAFTLDRPLTLIEAVARAKGLETGLYQRTTVELADLGHSFLVRNGEKLDINFEKLFLEGDLSQNVPIEPNDYIYFASTGARDIYVLGEVMNPGPLGFVDSATVLTAVTDRGGFSDRAYKRRVLVVRGSLNEPETFIINTDSALDGHLRDFRLQPRDIVYVSRRPWVKAEELLDEAAASFIQGAVTTWSGVNVGPIIKSRLLPRARPR